MTNYEEYYIKGRHDKRAGLPMTLPNTMTILHAYRGYMDGWSGRAFCEPEGMKQVYHPKNEAEEF
jgi:hypothetical protein